MSNKELYNDLDSKAIINKAGIETTGDDYTSAVMEKISNSPLPVKAKSLKIFSRKIIFIGIAIFSILILFLIYFAVKIPAASNENFTNHYSIFSNKLSILIKTVLTGYNIPLLIPLILFVIFILLSYDYYLNNKKKATLN